MLAKERQSIKVKPQNHVPHIGFAETQTEEPKSSLLWPLWSEIEMCASAMRHLMRVRMSERILKENSVKTAADAAALSNTKQTPFIWI